MPAFVRKHTVPSGEVLTLYPISYLAASVGRETQTIRKWEISGILPESMFRDNKGNRLYSGEQIDCITRVAERCKISQGKSISNTNFSRFCTEELNAIKEKYLKKGSNNESNTKAQEKGE